MVTSPVGMLMGALLGAISCDCQADAGQRNVRLCYVDGVTGEWERRQGDNDDGREHWKLER